MDTGAIIVSVVSVCAAAGGVIFGIAQILRAKKQDDTEGGKQSGIVLTELGYIKSSVDDIKRKQERQEEQTMKFLTDLTAVQESAKQAHKRIDTIEARLGRE